MPKNKIQFFTKVKDGHVSCRHEIQTALKCLDGKSVVITIEEKKRKRTNNQNAFYWGVILPKVAEFFRGYGSPISTEEAHNYIKGHVLNLERFIETPSGSKTILGSTTESDTIKWEEDMDAIRYHFAEWGLILPYPHEYDVMAGAASPPLLSGSNPSLATPATPLTQELGV